MVRFLILNLLLVSGFLMPARGTELVANAGNRLSLNLAGNWNIIIDPYESGYYDYHDTPLRNGYFQNRKPRNPSELIEYSFDSDRILHVPGDWNHQDPMLFLYEGTIWYHRSFDCPVREGARYILYFGAVNYEAKVFLNGEFVGEHTGGFTPFNFEVTGRVKATGNDLVVKADNRRRPDAVPAMMTDWYNYGGITRDVLLLELPGTFIRDYFIQLKQGSLKDVTGWIRLDGPGKSREIRLRIPELGVTRSVPADADGVAAFTFGAGPELWSPENPKCYDVFIETESDTVHDRIGFRTVTVKGGDILLNGRPVFLRGISIHEEAPFMGGARAWSREQAETLLGWAKELNCNFVRLAHYPHNEQMVRAADETGLLVWAEIPVYWAIQWENENTYHNAENQLTEMIVRDKNRASVILWSVGNETPVTDSRLKFMQRLIRKARQLDSTRLITAAMDRHYREGNVQRIEDPLGAGLDVLGCNEYLGWYDGLPDKCDGIQWEMTYDKPLIVSEFGGGALAGFHGDRMTRWTEEYQAYVYEKNLKMLGRMPFLRGMSPWILKDFRSPRRPLPRIQDFWNRKGLVSDEGQRKQAFFILQRFYEKMGPH